jgi:hypothetical protein
MWGQTLDRFGIVEHISLGLDQHIEDLALDVNGAPEIHHPAIDFQIDLVETPSRARLRAATS